MDLEKFFDPKSVAVIGASTDKNKVGFSLVRNLQNGAKRNIYPITLNSKEVLGIPAFTSVADVPANIELAIITLKSDMVPQALEDCGKKRIPNVIVISAGFKEIGMAGEKLEEKISEIAKNYNISLLGPNCLGVINTSSDLNASFSAQKPLPGNIAFLSQSGALGTALVDWSANQGVGLSKFISLGNEARLTEIEFLEYLENDPSTLAIFMYLENVNNGPKFMEITSRIAPKKPIVVIKAGIGSHGNLAIKSHTGALAPQASVFISACKQAGAITVSSLREFFHIVKILSQTIAINSPIQRLAVLTNGGGPSVVAADLIDRSCSLSLAALSENTKEELRKALPPMAAIGNPIDIIGDALADRYDKALQILIKEENIDGIMVILTPQMMTEAEETAKILAKHNNSKKIFPVFIGGLSLQAGRDELIKSGLPYFTFPRDVIESLDYMAKGTPKIRPLHGHLKDFEESTPGGEEMMKFEDVLKLLSEYGIFVSGKFLARKEDLENVLHECGKGHYAMKAVSSSIIHKTEKGAVRLNIKDLDEAEMVWEELWQKFVHLEGILVQKMVGGKEVIIGMKRDITFGPTLIFGIGGIFAEAIKDVSMRIAPIGREEALKMMKEIKGIKILENMRREKSVNFDILADIILNLSRLALEHPEIKEIDLNPIMATDTSATIVDVRVMI